MKRVVINADDYGLTDGVCRSIHELLDEGAVSNTTMILAADGAIERIRAAPKSLLVGRTGVHLQLTSGRPISPAGEVASLVTSSTGCFHGIDDLDGIDLSDVEVEWRRQIETACVLLGDLPSHLDSHHHVALRPGCDEVYVRLAKEFGIPVRGGQGSVAARMEWFGVTGPTEIVDGWSGRYLDAASLTGRVESALGRSDLVEVISHPGFNDPILERVSSLNRARENDHQVLRELAQVGWPAVAGYLAVSYPTLGRDTHTS